MKVAVVLLVILLLASKSHTKLAPAKEQKVPTPAPSKSKILISGPSIYKFAYDSDLLAGHAAALKQRKNDRRLPGDSKASQSSSTASPNLTGTSRLHQTGSAIFDDDDNNTEVYSLQKTLSRAEGLSWRSGNSSSAHDHTQHQIQHFEPIVVKSDVKVRSGLLLVGPAAEDPASRRDLIAPTSSMLVEPSRISFPASLVDDLMKDSQAAAAQLTADTSALSPKAATSRPPVAEVRLVGAGGGGGGATAPLITINSRGLIRLVENKATSQLNSSFLSTQMDHSLSPIGSVRPVNTHQAQADVVNLESGSGAGDIASHQAMSSSADRPAFLRRPSIVSANLWRPNSSSLDLEDSSLDEPTNKLRPQALNFDLHPSPAGENSKLAGAVRFQPNPPYRQQPLELAMTPTPALLQAASPSSTHASSPGSLGSAKQQANKHRPVAPAKPHRLGMSAPSSARPAEVSSTSSPYEFVSNNSTIAPQLNVLGQTGSPPALGSPVSKPAKMINRLQHMLLTKLIKNQMAQAGPQPLQSQSALSAASSLTPLPGGSGTPAPLLSSTVAHNVASLLAQKLNIFGRPSSLFGLRAPVKPKERLSAGAPMLLGSSQSGLNRRTAGVGSLLVSGFIYGLSMLPALMALTGVNPLAASGQASSAPANRGGERKLRRPLDQHSSIAYLVPLVSAGSLEPESAELLDGELAHDAQPSGLQALYAPPPTIIEPPGLLEPSNSLESVNFAAPSRKHRDLSASRASSSAERENWSIIDGNLAGFKPKHSPRKPLDERRQLGDSHIDNMGKLSASWPIYPSSLPTSGSAGASASSFTSGYNANNLNTNNFYTTSSNNKLSQSDLASAPFVFESRGPTPMQLSTAYGSTLGDPSNASVTHYRQHSKVTPSERDFNYLSSSLAKANQLLASDHQRQPQVLVNQVAAGTSLVHPNEQRPTKRHRKYLQANSKLSIPSPIEQEPTGDNIFIVGPYQLAPVKNDSSGHLMMTPSTSSSVHARENMADRAPVRMAVADDSLKVTFALDNGPVFLPGQLGLATLKASGARETSARIKSAPKWTALELAPMSQASSGLREARPSSVMTASLAESAQPTKTTRKTTKGKKGKKRKKAKAKGGAHEVAIPADGLDEADDERLVSTERPTSTTDSPQLPPVDFDHPDDESELLLAHSMAMGTRTLNEPLTGDHL